MKKVYSKVAVRVFNKVELHQGDVYNVIIIEGENVKHESFFLTDDVKHTLRSWEATLEELGWNSLEGYEKKIYDNGYREVKQIELSS